MMRALLALMLLCTSLVGWARDTRTQIFDPRFRTLKVQMASSFYAPPILDLKSDDALIVSFDLLAEDVEYMQYSLTHCNADWQPSSLSEAEYLDGFNVAPADDWAFSSNTFVHYVNYRIVIPNDHMAPLVAGNYLLTVYPENKPEDVLLQVRFGVLDSRVAVRAQATARTDFGINGEYQQVSLTVDPGNFDVRDPFNDFVVVVEQNGRDDMPVVVSHPQRIDTRKLIYEHQRSLLFPAGNEFRRFETVRTTYPGLHTDSVRNHGYNYHAYLMTDESRADAEYVYDQTQNGRFKVDEYNSSDPDLSADYVTVHFTLDFPEVVDGEVYVAGEFSNYLPDERYRMTYDRSRGAYTLELPLKQGSYNYQYVVRHRGSREPLRPELIEGNKYETRNEYVVKVYHRPAGSRGDRLVGFAQILNDN